MGLKESLRKLQEDEKLDVKKEVKKEFTKIKKEIKKEGARLKKCIICNDRQARYILKGTSDVYCRECAIEYFGDLDHLKKI